MAGVGSPPPSAAFLTGCIAVHAEAVSPRGADGLHGLCVALAAQPSLEQKCTGTLFIQGQLPHHVSSKARQGPPAPHSIGHPAVPAAGWVSGTGVREQGTGDTDPQPECAGERGQWVRGSKKAELPKEGADRAGCSSGGCRELWGPEPGRGGDRELQEVTGNLGGSSTVPGMGLNLTSSRGIQMGSSPDRGKPRTGMDTAKQTPARREQSRT